MTTYQDLAKLYGVHIRTVRRWADKVRENAIGMPLGTPDTRGKIHFSEDEVRQIERFAPSKPTAEIFETELLDEEEEVPVLRASARSLVPISSPTVAQALTVHYEQDSHDISTLQSQQQLAAHHLNTAVGAVSHMFGRQIFEQLTQVKEAVVANGVSQILETVQSEAMKG